MQLRRAVHADIPALTALIDASVRGLGPPHYNKAQIDRSLEQIFGVDLTLIEDGTYFVFEADEGIVAGGGWSRRRTLCGSSGATSLRDDSFRDPTIDAAIIRAVYVHPRWARRGLSRKIMQACEEDACAHGFARYEMISTLPGVAFYLALGYRTGEPFTIPMRDAVDLPCVRMLKP